MFTLLHVALALVDCVFWRYAVTALCCPGRGATFLHCAGDHSVTMDLEDSGDGNDLLADNTMDGLDCPPELPQTGQAPAALPQVAETPRQAVIQPAVTPYSQPRSVFPGGCNLKFSC